MGDSEDKVGHADPRMRLPQTHPSTASSSTTSQPMTIPQQTNPMDLISLRDDHTAFNKTKRRRTSPQDHCILEAAYKKNSKPDKNERTQVVNQVQMGEKEVQIWFQNRRQNDRRRSKPLDTRELMVHMHKPQSPSAPGLNSNFEEQEPGSNEISASHHAHPTPTPSPTAEPQSSPPLSSCAGAAASPANTHESAKDDFVPIPVSVSGVGSSPSTATKIKSEEDRQQTPRPALDNRQDGDVSPSSRKRSHAEMHLNIKTIPDVPIGSSDGFPSESHRPLKRSSSVRLSMTVDGSVKIRTNDEPTPSPPKERTLPPSSAQGKQTKVIRRSLSLFEDHSAESGNPTRQPRVLDAGFGRSRDTRTWEFYCDTTSNDALSTQVEAERNGSAVSAINLIRSNSSKARGHAMNAPSGRLNAPLGGSKTKEGKPKMMRAQSSLARLQSYEADVTNLKGSKKAARHIRSTSGDSDKENWAPGTRLSTNPLRRTQPTNNRRAVLQSNEIRDARPQPSAANNRSPLKTNTGEEDLDCVQGLLSLSQGAWR